MKKIFVTPTNKACEKFPMHFTKGKLYPINEEKRFFTNTGLSLSYPWTYYVYKAYPNPKRGGNLL